MTQTTDDPAIPQQGPVTEWLKAHDGVIDIACGAHCTEDGHDPMDFGPRVDAAFDALESALRHAKYRSHDYLPTMCDGCAETDAALALAEAVRS